MTYEEAVQNRAFNIGEAMANNVWDDTDISIITQGYTHMLAAVFNKSVEQVEKDLKKFEYITKRAKAEKERRL